MKSAQMQIVSERPLCRGWEQCFNYPDNLLSGGETVVTRWPYAQQSQLIFQIYLSLQVVQDMKERKTKINADSRFMQWGNAGNGETGERKGGKNMMAMLKI